MILVYLCIIGAIIVLSFAAYGIASRPKSNQLISRSELKALRSRASSGERGLRKIANGAGNPILEAEIYLTQIESTYETPKEIE